MTCPRERLLRIFTSAPAAFFRHDVDLSLTAAERMARFAQLAGVTSTFYLNPRSDWYHLFSREGERTISTILECGHRIGLHCDHRAGDPRKAVERDFKLLDAAYPSLATFGRLVSFHMPRTSVLWRDFDEFENAYASRWYGRYLSDSRGEWTAEKEAAITNEHQINLHPIHWFS